MKNEIINNIDNPAILERLYRDNKSKFKNEFQKFRTNQARQKVKRRFEDDLIG